MNITGSLPKFQSVEYLCWYANGPEIFENARQAFRTFHAKFLSLHATPNFRHGRHAEFLSSHPF